ncbi:MAG: SDR family oxidoreductase [Spirochaetaceae bacterium]|jgi:NAD(P)-dependent dehydrogenase (short-subunit alcohol dehydrogenase family)|nr:SDR family oxidoreductase [Spirochaetaceae bacterium]
MRIAVIGANQGLGLALSRYAAEHGDVVYAAYRNKPSAKAAEAAKELANYTLIELDVTSEAQAEAGAQKINADGGKLDALVITAGVLADSDRTRQITDTSIEDLRAALEVNVIGSAIVIKHFHHLIKDGGIFITVTSEAGSMTNIGTKYPGYSISKAAQNKLTAIFAKTESRYTVCAVHPGRMNTVMGRNDAQIEPEESAEGLYQMITGENAAPAENGWFIDYRGGKMEI